MQNMLLWVRVREKSAVLHVYDSYNSVSVSCLLCAITSWYKTNKQTNNMSSNNMISK